MKWEDKVKKFGKPIKGEKYQCQLASAWSDKTVEEILIYVEEEDNLWRTADDRSEVDEWNWNVISWVKI